MMSPIRSYILLVCLGCAVVSQGLAFGIQEGDIDASQKVNSNTLVIDSVREKREVDNAKGDDKDANKKKDTSNPLYTKFLQLFVNMYRHKNVSGEEEKEDDFFCESEDRDSYGPGIDQVDIPAQVFKYLTKYVVKRSYTPFTYIKSTLETFGVINPIDNEIHKKELSVINVNPLTQLFSSMQEVYNSYEDAEREEESAKLLNMLAHSSDDDIKKSGIITKLWPASKPKPNADDDDNGDKKKSKCVLKKPEDLWEEIMPYDPYIIMRSFLAAGAWLFAFWVPIFPFIFSFPSRNGGGIFVFDGDDDGNRRDHEAYDYYDSNDSHYSTYEGNYIGAHSDKHSSHDSHLSHSSYASDINNNAYQASHGEASHTSLGDIVKHHISNSHKVAGTQNVFVSNAQSDDIQEVSSYTHYDAYNLWYNHV